MKPGERMRVKHGEYNWHGNGSVGEVDHVDPSYGVYLKFANGHTAYFNLDDVTKTSDPVSECPQDSKCKVLK